MEKDINEHLTVENNDLKKYLKYDKQKVVGDALRSQGKTKQPIFIKKDTVLNHFWISSFIFLGCKNGRKHK